MFVAAAQAVSAERAVLAAIVVASCIVAVVAAVAAAPDQLKVAAAEPLVAS